MNWLDVLIWSTIMTDQSTVDADETLFRIRFLEKLGHGPATETVPAEMIRRWHGTTVNVSPKTRQQFVTRWARVARQDVESAVAREILAAAS